MNGFPSRLWGTRFRRLSTGAGIIAMVGAFSALPAHGGDGVINVNQHKTQEYVPVHCPQPPPPEGCDTCLNPTTGCPENQALPENALGQYSLVDANAYHVRGGEAGECKFAKVRCKYDAHSRPKIVSSDDGYVPHADAHRYMQVIAGRDVGTYHYEYWDMCLSEYAKESNVIPDTIPGHDPFPNASICQGYGAGGSQNMAVWIGDPSHGVVSESETMLLQNGWLHRDIDSPLLKWKAGTGAGFVDDAMRLMGFGYMGALGAGPDRLLAAPYMKALRRYNINFTRVWAIEAWTALRNPRGPMPFPLDASNKYDLWEDNPVYYNHLRNFAQQAADRGIVIQHSIFDKHGLIYHNANYRYKDSPYRDDNNNDGRFNWLESIIPDDDCGPQDAEERHPFPLSVEEQPSDCQPLYSFIENADMALVHKRFIRRTAEEVGGIGNMMFEIINEAIAPGWPAGEVGDWADDAPPPSTTTKNQQWQMDLAKELRLGLPVAVARDAFNGDLSGTNLGNKHSDVEGIDWIPPTYGAQVKVSNTETGGLGPARRLGYVTSSQAQPFMVGTVALRTGQTWWAFQTWTKLHVRADLECLDGELRLGTRSQATGGDEVYVAFTCPEGGTDLPWSLLRLYKKVGSQTTYLAAVSIADPAGVHNVRLTIENSGGNYSATVFVDGERASNTVALGPIAGFTHAFFWGQVPGQNPYPVDKGKVDNFEAAVFCGDQSRGCQP